MTKGARRARGQGVLGGAKRIRLLSLFVIIGALSGFLLSVCFGDNFRTRVLRVERLGTFYRVSLPSDIRELTDVRLANIGVAGASDFARNEINNYWLSSTERPEYLVNDDNPMTKEITKKYGVQRNNGNRYIDGPSGILLQLRKRRNFIVFEMENKGIGYCAGGFRVDMNGSQLHGVPFDGPSDRGEVYAQIGIAPSESQFVTGFPDVLCTRRIIEIDLSPETEPLRRLQQLFGLQTGLQ
jgi:hypothetical protein